MDINGPTTTLDRNRYPLSSDRPEHFAGQLLSALLSLRDGDFGVRLPADLTDVNGKIADAFNDIAAVNLAMKCALYFGVSRCTGCPWTADWPLRTPTCCYAGRLRPSDAMAPY